MNDIKIFALSNEERDFQLADKRLSYWRPCHFTSFFFFKNQVKSIIHASFWKINCVTCDELISLHR